MAASDAGVPDWADAPAGTGWNWLAQDADGRWFWYRTEPQLNWSGGVWRSNSRNQQFAADGAPDPNWDATLRVRPGHEG
ncbi:MAG: hypothetical protein OZ923_07130 [Comamonadaceae bacterium]|nr:hypothetical protein [Burkholderiales bacterium]MEB2348369.1 hypothetical protein [Comamonadaceae bacterium]